MTQSAAFNAAPDRMSRGVCYTSQMRSWRHSALSRAVVLAILVWTGADLGNASLCALENESEEPTSAIAATGDCLVLRGASESDVPPAQAPHVDDCFCCSHCVEVAWVGPALGATIVPGPRVPSILSAPSNLGSSLYHPPQVSLQ